MARERSPDLPTLDPDNQNGMLARSVTLAKSHHYRLSLPRFLFAETNDVSVSTVEVDRSQSKIQLPHQRKQVRHRNSRVPIRNYSTNEIALAVGILRCRSQRVLHTAM
jgi:hypothetical protein